MRVYVWTYRVKPEKVGPFRRAYAATGEWASLFSRSSDYLGTQLLNDASDPLRFATIDCFQSADGRARFLQANSAGYAELDRKWQDATTEEIFVGEFEIVE